MVFLAQMFIWLIMTWSLLKPRRENECDGFCIPNWKYQIKWNQTLIIIIIIIIIIIMWCMVTHTRNLCSAFNPSKCTHTAASSEHTHCEHAPGAVGSHCSSARGAIGGSVPCSRAPQSWYWRWRECCSFTIPTFNPCRTCDSNPQPFGLQVWLSNH